MTVLSQVNEKSVCWVTAAFTDKAGDPVTPSTVQYRIDSDGTQVKDWTSVTPGSSVEIEIDSADNTLLSQSAVLEPRTVTVKTTFGVDDEHYDEHNYLIKNLSGVT